MERSQERLPRGRLRRRRDRAGVRGRAGRDPQPARHRHAYIGCPEGCDEAIEATTLLDIVESSMSSEIYELMKRSDEVEVVEKAHMHPRFVEDCVREMVRKAPSASPASATRLRLRPPGEPRDDPQAQRRSRAPRAARRARRARSRRASRRAARDYARVARISLNEVRASPCRGSRILIFRRWKPCTRITEAVLTHGRHIPLSQDAALVVALAGTAIPFAHSAEDEAERWLRAMRLHGRWARSCRRSASARPR